MSNRTSLLDLTLSNIERTNARLVKYCSYLNSHSSCHGLMKSLSFRSTITILCVAVLFCCPSGPPFCNPYTSFVTAKMYIA